MTLVVLPVKPPAVLAGQSNGKLATSILVSMAGLNGGPTVRLVSTAARCWRALAGTASAAGIVLQATSVADSYRTYQQQVTTFTARYQVDPTTNGYKWWDSDSSGTPERWYKKDNVATAAVPGTSNHGWGLAVDVANASGARLRWLEANAVRFGWSWETVPEEPWHIRNVTGDAIPAAVIAYEEDQMSVWDERLPNPAVNNRLDPAGDFLRYGNNYAAAAAKGVSALDARMTAIEATLAQVLALLQSGVPVATAVHLDAQGLEQVRGIVDQELDEQSRAGADQD